MQPLAFGDIQRKKMEFSVPLGLFVRSVFVTASWGLTIAWATQAIAVARGLRRLPLLQDPTLPPVPSDTSVSVIVPACNEEKGIGPCLESLLQQDYGNLHIIAVDDRSTDRTGAIMEDLLRRYPDRLSVLHITVLPEGWLGKTNAMALGARHAKSLYQPQWLLFTDGDVLFHPECLRRSLAFAESERADHLVTVPTAIVRTAGEAMVMAYLQVMGLWGVRMWRVADPAARDTIGVGAFNLLRTAAYDQLGGFELLRLQILEDLALARTVKDSGLRQRVVLGPNLVRIHWAPGVRGILNTMTKNLFAIFRFRILLMAAACCSITVLCLGPVAGLGWAHTRIPSLLSLLAIAVIYRIVARYLSPLNPATILGFPVGAMLFLFAILRSSILTTLQGGVYWRGTFYELKELRRVALKLR